MKHVVMFSGGVGSWAAAKRVAHEHGTANLTLLFADTRMEDEDLYRFLDEAAANVGAPLVKLAEGRTPWEVFRDERFIGNNRVDLCSRMLKREILDRWRNANCDPDDTTIHIGIDWTEQHRLKRLLPRVAPWRYEAPMCEPPLMSKEQMLQWLESEGICRPRLYRLGFPHNNCGGFCVKAGQAHFLHLLKMLPERYAYHEAQEEKMRADVGPEATVLKDRKGGGPRRALSLRELRERHEAGDQQLDLFDWGGCGCAVDDQAEAVQRAS